jgi:ATP-dependent helicase HrpA
MSKWFVRDTPYEKLVHFPRYLKGVHMRIDKLKSDPHRDGRLMADLTPLLTQYQRAVNSLKGAHDAQLTEFRWLLEELRVSMFAQTLRTPMPVSVKRLQKAWSVMHR